jgi:transposase InsO family protein
MNRIRTAWAVRSMAKAKSGRRGQIAQISRRQAERAVRKSTLAFARWSAWHGLGQRQTAAMIDLSAATLANWQRDWRSDRMEIELRGRPAGKVDQSTRQALLAIFHLMGPGIGLPTLRAMFPEGTRGELEDLLERFRHLWKKGGHALIFALRWLRPGTVWAMDWFEPPKPIDGIYPYVLVVRDLASGLTLWSLPSLTKDAKAAADVLAALFLEFGPPLVLKSDNEFNAAEIVEVLAKNSVLHLLSPPGLPSYNGSCEAGVGGVKTRAHYEAARHDRPGEWTCDDVYAAGLLANQTHRPNGYLEPTPDQAWAARAPIAQELRQNFIKSVQDLQPEARQELGFLPNIDLDRWGQAAVNRVAISRACVASGFLQVRRKRFSPPITRKITRYIS